jgi:hypothetical protein
VFALVAALGLAFATVVGPVKPVDVRAPHP